jgi:chaperonin GroES
VEDELLFIVQHQTTELWFKLVLHELRSVRRYLDVDDISRARKALHSKYELDPDKFGRWCLPIMYHHEDPLRVARLADPSFDLGGRARRRHAGVGGVAFEASDLAHELVTVLSGKASEVGFPRGRQGQDGTSLFHGYRRGETARGRDLREQRGGRRGGRHGVQLPLDALARSGLEQRHPRLFLAPGHRNQIEIVGNVGAAQELERTGRGLMKWQERDQPVRSVVDAVDREPAAVREDPGPLGLPRPGEERRLEPGGRDEAGKLIPIDIKVGDRVLFGKWSGTEVKLDGEELLIMKESDIMGVLTDLPAAKKKAA